MSVGSAGEVAFQTANVIAMAMCWTNVGFAGEVAFPTATATAMEMCSTLVEYAEAMEPIRMAMESATTLTCAWI
jgi:hypothetical protein